MGRTDYIYFIIDVSNSMRGAKLGSVNDAIHNTIHRLKKVVNNSALDIKLVVMTFAKDVTWSGVLPVSLNAFVFEDLCVEACESAFGKALGELDEKLLRQEAVWSQAGETTILLFSDGLSTDDYDSQIKKLYRNKIFMEANRIAFTYGSAIYNLIKEPLCAFAGKESNIVIDDFITLDKMLLERYRQVNNNG
ncbi:MAG: VWA domain-containing protein [Lachnospiraceae bacterium]|nr:VWA domain-containing protein [Lachnospiraceae bacterium]